MTENEFDWESAYYHFASEEENNKQPSELERIMDLLDKIDKQIEDINEKIK